MDNNIREYKADSYVNDNGRKRIIKTVDYNGEKVDTVWMETRRPYADWKTPYDPLPEELKGTHEFHYPLDTRTFSPAPGIICDRDQAVKMRDGVTIYCDIFRPDTEEKVPVIISWTSYGKRPIWEDGHAFMYHMGVPHGTNSPWCKFESPDPGFWVHQGYAVANVDPRGIGWSEGDYTFFGSQEGRDGYDFVEWVTSLPWCNGKAGMFGNSAGAINQWFIAAECPPHLACIAPWEGTVDKFAEQICEGGIPGFSFQAWLENSLIGTGYIDDVGENGKLYPKRNAYWEDKRAKVEKIRIPVYTTVSWSHIHMHGSFDAFRRIRTSKKWIRCHRDFEWADSYTLENQYELKNFFDRFLKEIYNGWELTPHVRIDVMDQYDCDYQIRRTEEKFPLKRTQYTNYYLDAAHMTMNEKPYAEESSVSYDGNTGCAEFDMVFDEETELTGYFKLHLWVEADGNDDMDLFINVQKADKDGNFLPTSVLEAPHPGAWGKLRVSCRELDQKRSTDFCPEYTLTSEQKMKPGEIVPVDISIWPISKIYHKGEKLRVQIAGRYIRDGWHEPFSWETNNVGNHIIHTGGKYDSYLMAPVIPPRVKVGDYIKR